MAGRIGRRSFLKGLGVGAVAGVEVLYPGLARATGRTDRAWAGPTSLGSQSGTNVVQIQGLDPTYALGEVVSKTPEGVVLQSGLGSRAVRVPPGTVVWKEFDLTPDAIQLHDWVDVKGTALSDGSLLARSGWLFVNIGRQDGVLGQVANQAVTLVSKPANAIGATRRSTLELSSRLEVVYGNDGSPVAGGVAGLRVGAEVGAVGLRLPNGVLRATKIWMY